MFEAMMFAKSRCKHGQCTKLIRSRPAEIVQIGKMRQAVPVARKPPRHPLSWKGGRNRLSDTTSAFFETPARKEIHLPQAAVLPQPSVHNERRLMQSDQFLAQRDTNANNITGISENDLPQPAAARFNDNRTNRRTEERRTTNERRTKERTTNEQRNAFIQQRNFTTGYGYV